MRVALAIPTYNAGEKFNEIAKRISTQKEWIEEILIVDSNSEDNTVEIANKYGFTTNVIPRESFSHAGTRSEIAEKMYKLGYDFLIFMSHDVYLQTDAIKELLAFVKKNENIGVVRGRQEVDLNKGNLFEYFARKHNYDEFEKVYYKKDIPKYGIDTIYTSDAFSIYNLEALNSINYFGESKNVSEDMFAAHNLIQAGYGIGYAAKSKVYHTHNYSVVEEFNRYISIGKFYKDNDSWISLYGKTEKKGYILAVNEILFLIKKKKYILIPLSLIRNMAKFLGFRVGNMKGNKNV